MICTEIQNHIEQIIANLLKGLGALAFGLCPRLVNHYFSVRGKIVAL